MLVAAQYRGARMRRCASVCVLCLSDDLEYCGRNVTQAFIEKRVESSDVAAKLCAVTISKMLSHCRVCMQVTANAVVKLFFVYLWIWETEWILSNAPR